KVTCNALNVSKDFCLFTVKGIPESRCGGVVDIWNLVGDLKNTQVFYAPNKAVLKARVRVPAQGSQPGLGIPGPWFPVYVCCNGDLNVAKKFAKVTTDYGRPQGPGHCIRERELLVLPQVREGLRTPRTGPVLQHLVLQDLL
ncbi:MAG: hypothetical protein ACYTGI_17835, partial [Planctomycetota bacterium]